MTNYSQRMAVGGPVQTVFEFITDDPIPPKFIFAQTHSTSVPYKYTEITMKIVETNEHE